MISLKTLNLLIKRAIELSVNCDGRCQHISFILKRNKILSDGWNSMNKTDAFAERLGYSFPYIHSELSAIRNFKYKLSQLKGCTIVNVRVGKENYKPLVSKPCKDCMRMIDAFGLNEVVYFQFDQWQRIKR